MDEKKDSCVELRQRGRTISILKKILVEPENKTEKLKFFKFLFENFLFTKPTSTDLEMTSRASFFIYYLPIKGISSPFFFVKKFITALPGFERDRFNGAKISIIAVIYYKIYSIL
jgi:hypothetical protein